jgi:hypothetical protein
VLVPAIDRVARSQAAALEACRTGGCAVVGFAAPSAESALLDRFWAAYEDEDRVAILEACGVDDNSRIWSSAPHVVATRYVLGNGGLRVHLLNYDYRQEDDEIEPARDVVLRIPWAAGSRPVATVVSLGGRKIVPAGVSESTLVVSLPELVDHAVLEIMP